MNGPLKAAWALTAFVVVAGVVLWITTDRPVFAVFIVLGLLTGAGAWITGRSLPKEDTTP
ncbi:hypothetical protein [Blastococcus sp. TF02A-26]|uniref:hypothetical protein n=1 Tax=Blastococcus sp. TF02A-26 TaxID=2250577 RepID=UPI000DEBF9D9|nr:hypothetical protein [Blastococcus sp. TF02A-26]RBY83922.1 hypothetical protein DQ240_15755 [Blastococcus sp. TF02A-26]